MCSFHEQKVEACCETKLGGVCVLRVGTLFGVGLKDILGSAYVLGIDAGKLNRAFLIFKHMIAGLGFKLLHSSLHKLRRAQLEVS